jgi:hypothetical protein
VPPSVSCRVGARLSTHAIHRRQVPTLKNVDHSRLTNRAVQPISRSAVPDHIRFARTGSQARPGIFPAPREAAHTSPTRSWAHNTAGLGTLADAGLVGQPLAVDDVDGAVGRVRDEHATTLKVGIAMIEATGRVSGQIYIAAAYQRRPDPQTAPLRRHQANRAS